MITTNALELRAGSRILLADATLRVQPGDRIGEREKLVATGQRRGAAQQDVLDVIQFKHGGVASGSLHLIQHRRE